jgi:tetratricopeptide (TPR) repeat protein
VQKVGKYLKFNQDTLINTLNRLVEKLTKAEEWDVLTRTAATGLLAIPKEPVLLRAGQYAWRMKGDTKRAFYFSKKLRKYQLQDSKDIIKEIQILLLLGRVSKAMKCLRRELAQAPRDKDYLSLASDICRIRGQGKKSILFAYRLIKNHPQSWRGYQRAAEDRIALGHCQEAKQVLEEGISRLVDQELAHGLAIRLQVNTCQTLLNRENTKTFMDCWQSIQVWADPCNKHAPLPYNHKNLPTLNEYALRPQTRGHADIQAIQYWSQGQPPSEITAISDQWNSILASSGLKPISLYSRQMAGEWIEINAPEFSIPFNTAFHNAVESDVFRIAYASKKACIYIDCDQWPFNWTGEAIRAAISTGASTICMSSASPKILNGIFIAQESCPYFEKIATSCAYIDFSKRKINAGTILNTFGPGKYLQAMKYLLGKESDRVGFKAVAHGLAQLDIGPNSIVLANEKVIGADKPPTPLAYKQSEQQWQIFLAKKAQ